MKKVFIIVVVLFILIIGGFAVFDKINEKKKADNVLLEKSIEEDEVNSIDEHYKDLQNTEEEESIMQEETTVSDNGGDTPSYIDDTDSFTIQDAIHSENYDKEDYEMYGSDISFGSKVYLRWHTGEEEGMFVCDAVSNANNLMGKTDLVLERFRCTNVVNMANSNKKLAILRLDQDMKNMIEASEEGYDYDYMDIMLFLDVTDFKNDIDGRVVTMQVDKHNYKLITIPPEYNNTIYDSTFLVMQPEEEVIVEE